jgi:hypothetical protein
MPTLSLTGKNTHNLNNLTGKNNMTGNNIPLEIKNIKIKILDFFLLPLVSKNWNKLKENIFFIDVMRNKINYYNKIYNFEDTKVYLDILNSIEFFINQNDNINNLEKQIYKNQGENIFHSTVFKTSQIKLKPEYEIYNFIYGRPKKNCKYNDDIIYDIQILLKKDNISFEYIQIFLTKKYIDILI